jgi:hypothetical protein
MKRILGLIALAAMSVLLPSCASDEAENPDRVSTIPWNRPEKWEGQGALGGMLNNQ